MALAGLWEAQQMANGDKFYIRVVVRQEVRDGGLQSPVFGALEGEVGEETGWGNDLYLLA